jgi:Zn-dependent peptidase ImmA (M78 family)
VSTAELIELGVTPKTTREETLAVIRQFSETRNLSNTFVAYNLYKLGYLSWEKYENLSKEFREQWQARKQAKKASQGSGPSYHLVKRHRLGGAITEFVSRMMGEGVLSPTKAAKILGVKTQNIRQVLG